MDRHAAKLRDQAARPTLRRIRVDQRRVAAEIKPLLEVIEARLFDPGFDVNRLWRESGVKKWVSGRFAEELGASPGAYISAGRLEVGAALLGFSRLKVFKIAEVIGYSTSRDTFSRAFQRWSGMTPARYRAQARANGGPSPLEPEASLAVGELIDAADRASASGDVAGARQGLARADSLLRDRQVADLAARLGVSLHERGAERTRAGDVDRAFEDLRLARECYGTAGELSPAILRQRRHVPVSHATDEAFLSAFCPDCRHRLAGAEGRLMRQSLRRALLLVPRDDPWFEASCNDCYRAVWAAVSRARLGLMNDAWKAWWLSSNVDPRDRESPPSRGRFIAAMAEVERLYSGNQLERKGYADLAVEDAVSLGDPLLETQGRLWLGAVLAAMSEFAEAKAQLNGAAAHRPKIPWLSALEARAAGLFEFYRSNYSRSLRHLESSRELYRGLDPHISGLLVIQQGNVHFQLADYRRSLELNQQAMELLDERRDPLPGNGAVPIHLATSHALLGEWEKAELALSRCRYDRDANAGLAAIEVSTSGCLALLKGRLQMSASLFLEARERFAKLDIPRAAALAASYSVEVHARLGQRSMAIETAMAALSFFQAAGCSRDTLDVLGKLRALLEAEAVDVNAVATKVRGLTRQHGGWLPEPR